MASKNASPLTPTEIRDIRDYLWNHPNATLDDAARAFGWKVPGLKARALKAGKILRSRLCLDDLFPERNVDK